MENRNQPNHSVSRFGEHFIKKLDAFLYDKPANNVMKSIDQFFEQARGPERIPVDVLETDEEWLVKVELPGIKKEQIQINFLGNQLTIDISHKHETEQVDQTYHYYHKERKEFRNRRTVTLPYVVDKRTAKASFSEGILKIWGPKLEADQNKMTID